MLATSSFRQNSPIFDQYLLPLILGKLENPKDLHRAKLVCKLWNQCVRPLNHMKHNNYALYEKLIQLKPYVQEGKLFFSDDSSPEKLIALHIMIVQRYREFQLRTSGIAAVEEITSYPLNFHPDMQDPDICFYSLEINPKTRELENGKQLLGLRTVIELIRAISVSENITFKATQKSVFDYTVTIPVIDILKIE